MAAQIDDLNLLKPICLFEQLFDYKLRLNDTPPDKLADFTINSDIIGTASGSAMVTVGGTRVICGVKVKVMPIMNVDTVFTCVVEHLGLSQRCIRPNMQPTKDAQSLSVQLEWILSSYVIPDAKEQLKIYGDPSQQESPMQAYGMYLLNIDIVILHDDGCLLDACLSAAVAALSSASWPRLYAPSSSIDSRTTSKVHFKEIPSGSPVKLTISEWPVALTFCIVPRLNTVSNTEKTNIPLICQPTRRELLLWDTDATLCQLILGSNNNIIDFSLVGGFASGLWTHLEDSGICETRNVLDHLINLAYEHFPAVQRQLKKI